MKLVLLAIHDSSSPSAPPEPCYFIVETILTNKDLETIIETVDEVYQMAVKGNEYGVVNWLNDKGLIKILDYEEYSLGLYFITKYGKQR